jgi:hypothetical protein
MFSTSDEEQTMTLKSESRVPEFTFNDTAITNPTASECGRFEVSPEHYGFAVADTGGGCTAWRKEMPDGSYFLITDADGATHWYGNFIAFGEYDADGCPLAFATLAVGVVEPA